jgi:basic membrane protein A
LGVVVIVIIAVAGVGAYVLLTPPLPRNPNDVAIVFATGGLGDKSFNDGCYRGASEAKAAFGMNFTYSEPTEIAQYEGLIRGYAAHAEYSTPYQLIVCIGFDQASALQKVSKEYPSQKFAIVDMYLDPTNYTNVDSLIFNAQESSALVGAIAGLMTTTNKIGFVGGMDIPLINAFCGGYIWGANKSNPGINFTFGYTNNWVDTAAGKTLADGMYAAGEDIIFAAAGRSGLGVIQSSIATNGTKAYPVWSIGVDSPQMYLGINPANGNSTVLTSALKRVDKAIYAQFAAIHTGTWAGGVLVGTLANDWLGVEYNSTLVDLPDGVISYVFSLGNQIKSGEVTVPSTKYWIH